MKYLIAALSAALLILGILVYYQGKQAARKEFEQKERERLHAEQISVIQAAAERDRAAVKRIQEQRTKDDSIFQASISAQKARTAREQRKVTELRPQINLLADSITVLAQFLEANDSLFHGKDVEIAMLNQKLQSDSVSHDLETRHLNNQIENLTAGHVEDHRTIEDLQTQLAKAEKKANKRIGFGINGGYGIQEHGGTITAGPTLSAGIHWTLFKL